jgi:hypothetical protein
MSFIIASNRCGTVLAGQNLLMMIEISKQRVARDHAVYSKIGLALVWMRCRMFM